MGKTTKNKRGKKKRWKEHYTLIFKDLTSEEVIFSENATDQIAVRIKSTTGHPWLNITHIYIHWSYNSHICKK